MVHNNLILTLLLGVSIFDRCFACNAWTERSVCMQRNCFPAYYIIRVW